jgi:hypothetical protein
VEAGYLASLKVADQHLPTVEFCMVFNCLNLKWNADLKSAANGPAGKSLTTLLRVMRRISNPRSIETPSLYGLLSFMGF